MRRRIGLFGATDETLALLRVEGQPGSELAGPAFDPGGNRMRKAKGAQP